MELSAEREKKEIEILTKRIKQLDKRLIARLLAGYMIKHNRYNINELYKELKNTKGDN